MQRLVILTIFFNSVILNAQYTEFIQHFGLSYSRMTMEELPVTYNAISYDARFSFANLYQHSFSIAPHLEFGLANNKIHQTPFQLYGAYGMSLMWSYGHAATSYSFSNFGFYSLIGLRGIAYEQRAIESIIWPKDANWSSGKYVTEIGFRCYIESMEESLGLGIGANWCSFQQQPVGIYLKFTTAIIP